ncbi:MAG: DUF721 domain-containing protein [Pontiellaceae bacterium]|nr:DUF721 domain-containing protein [Pontiellaceae bacterium]MBN2785532.1 DUF721 domain-containing protein [Pontiellaceae bacterium]
MARWDIDRVRYQMDAPASPRRDIRPIHSVLKDVLEGLEEPQCENTLVLKKAWPKMVGNQIAKHSEPASVEAGILTVGVNHPGWMPELERLKRLLLQKMQAQYPDLRIRQLRFVLLHR